MKEIEKLKLLEQSKQSDINSPLKKGSKFLNYSSNKVINKGFKMFVLNALQNNSKTQNSFNKKKAADAKSQNSNSSSPQTLIKNYNSNQITSNEKEDYNNNI
jgi:hypothetical protein